MPPSNEPHENRPWIVSQRWRDVLLAHWPVAPALLRGLVPPALELDLYGGTAWVTLVAMHMVDLHVRDLPPLPGTSDFPELNFRTYVRHGGRAGAYFLSIDAPGELADLVADRLFHLPYQRAEMTLQRDGDAVQFTSRRLDATRATFMARYVARGDGQFAAPGSLEHFLAERYSAFAVESDSTVLRGDIQHPAWSLRRADVTIAQNTVFAAVGLALPSAPFVAYAGQTDSIGWLPVTEGRIAASAAPRARAIDDTAARALTAEAAQRVDAADGDAEGRYQLRAAFYADPALDIAHYGASELAFLRWEIRRGVLAPLDASPAGSAWWRAVNRELLVAAEEALLRHDRNLTGAASPEVARWVEFLRAPSPVCWYRAHNASIVRGYLAYAELARRESELEQRLVTSVLTRLLAAQAMVDPPPRRGGRFEEDIERVVADPRSPAVDIIVHLADFYPERYPLAAGDAAAVLDRMDTPEGLLARVFDHDLIEPRLLALYRHAADVLGIPELLTLVADGTLRYPRPA